MIRLLMAIAVIRIGYASFQLSTTTRIVVNGSHTSL